MKHPLARLRTSLLSAGLAVIVGAFAARPSAQSASLPPSQPKPAPDFARDVLPVFESNCLRCHSAAAQKGDLILDTHEDLVQGGRHGAVIVAGDAQRSPLIGMMGDASSRACRRNR